MQLFLSPSVKYEEIAEDQQSRKEKPLFPVHALVQVPKKLSLVHRSRIDIIANILRAAEKGTRKTHIMYKCNLSYRQLHTYLDFMIERKLVKYIHATDDENSSGTYETTRKGKDFIQAYSSIRTLIADTVSETSD